MEKIQVTDGITLAVSYEYDLADRLTTITYLSGERVTFTRDTQRWLDVLGLDGPRTDVSDVTTFAYYPATDLSNNWGPLFFLDKRPSARLS